MRCLLLFAMLSFAACPVPQPSPPVPPPIATLDAGFPQCAMATPQPVTASVCGTLQTSNGLRCVACPSVSSDCLYAPAQVLCVRSCIGDHNCK